MKELLVWMLTAGWLFVQVCGNLPIIGGMGHKQDPTPIECPTEDRVCQNDKLGFEAIQSLHLQIDDDQNGNLDRSESDEFIRDELKYEDGFERHTSFHGNDDLISIQDLWLHWIKSDVYNWTVDDVIDWLIDDVELPQYTEGFRVNAVDGHVLPRIAANVQYLSSIVGVKNPVHKQKLALKAMDAVLFGPPKKGHSYVKDLLLVASLLIAVGGCWLAYIQHRYSQSHLSKVMQDLDTLQKAEDALTELQQKLEEAEKEQRNVAAEKQTIEQKMKSEVEQAKSEAERLKTMRETTEEEMSRLRLAEEELVQVRRALKNAEEEMGMPRLEQLAELQQWLQLTYEVENRHYETKREAAEKQLFIAKEMCEKIKRKRSSLLGSFRIAHTNSMDDTDHNIVKARAALEDLKLDLQERSHRWSQIEKICGFNISINPGLPYLETYLRGVNTYLHRPQSGSLMMLPTDLDAADDDAPPSALAYSVAFFNQGHSGKISLPHTSSLPGIMRRSGDQRVLPSLMQAGMQLSMLGLGLHSPPAASAPGKSVDPLVKRPTNLAKAFSSTSSLSGSASNLSVHRSLVSPVVSPSTVSPKGVILGSNGVRRSSNGSDGVQTSDDEKQAKPSRVEFDVDGDIKEYTDFISQQGDDKKINTRSVSMEVAKAQRPVTMSSSRSENNVSYSIHRRQASQNSTSPSSPRPINEEDSSPDSTDSANDSTLLRKKKKGKLIRKLFGDSEKSK